ncbi:hypothetical protein ScalyP_jg9812, partial [Parmales sp. scaly parma]
ATLRWVMRCKRLVDFEEREGEGVVDECLATLLDLSKRLKGAKGGKLLALEGEGEDEDKDAGDIWRRSVAHANGKVLERRSGEVKTSLGGGVLSRAKTSEFEEERGRLDKLVGEKEREVKLFRGKVVKLEELLALNESERGGVGGGTGGGETRDVSELAKENKVLEQAINVLQNQIGTYESDARANARPSPTKQTTRGGGGGGGGGGVSGCENNAEYLSIKLLATNKLLQAKDRELSRAKNESMLGMLEELPDLELEPDCGEVAARDSLFLTVDRLRGLQAKIKVSKKNGKGGDFSHKRIEAIKAIKVAIESARDT